MGRIRTATLNVRGLGEPHKRARIFQLLIHRKIDIALVTETHTEEENIQAMQDEWYSYSNNKSFFAASDQTGAKGVAILLGKDFPEENVQNQAITMPGGRILSLQVNFDGSPHKIMVSYAPNTPAQRRTFFEDINEREGSQIPVIWGGDFNHVDDIALDRKGGNPASRHTIGSTSVQFFKNAHNLVDPYRIENPTKTEFTWMGPVPENEDERIYAKTRSYPDTPKIPKQTLH